MPLDAQKNDLTMGMLTKHMNLGYAVLWRMEDTDIVLEDMQVAFFNLTDVLLVGCSPTDCIWNCQDWEADLEILHFF